MKSVRMSVRDEMDSLHFLSYCGQRQRYQSIRSGIQTVEFPSKAACDRALNELGTWAEKTYRYRNVVIALVEKRNCSNE